LNGTRIIFDCPVSPWFAAALALGVLGVVAVFLRRDTAGLKRGTRLAVQALFLAGIALMAGILLNPRIVRTWPDPQKPQLALLVDASRSMLLSDAYRGQDAEWIGRALASAAVNDAPRNRIVQALLGSRREDWLTAIRDGFDVIGSRFAENSQALSLGPESSEFRVDENGTVTALGDALQQAGREVEGRRPRSVVLVSDGAWNAGRDPAEAARVLGRLDVPVYAIGLGDPEPPRDVAVVALKGPEKGLVGDVLFLTAQVASTGMGPVKVRVELVDNGQVVADKQAVTLPSGRPVDVSFSHVPVAPGRHDFIARLVPPEDDRDAANNAATRVIQIVNQEIRVLLIDAEPRWEFRFIRSVLDRDPAVRPTICLLRPRVGPIKGEGYLDTLPTSQRGFTDFDLVILGDVSRRFLPDAFLAELADMVQQRAGALILVAGRHRGFRELMGTPLERILPVRLEGGIGGSGGAPFRVELTQDGADHLITRLSSEPKENEAAWESLPPVRWAAGVGETAPGAIALLVHPFRLAGAGKLPVLAVHRVGRGKAMFCGIEGTWRWRKTVGDKYHYRFWAQAVRWMIKKQAGVGDARARLALDRTECKVGDRVEVEVHCVDNDGFPLLDADVKARIAVNDGDARYVSLQPAAGGWGIYRGTFIPSRPGEYSIRPIVDLYGKKPLPSTLSLKVTRPDLERTFLAQDRNTLQAIAEASGGRYLSIGEMGTLPSLLAARAERRMLTAEYSPCRHWAYYFALAAVLSAAWIMKKWSGLA